MARLGLKLSIENMSFSKYWIGFIVEILGKLVLPLLSEEGNHGDCFLQRTIILNISRTENQ